MEKITKEKADKNTRQERSTKRYLNILLSIMMILPLIAGSFGFAYAEEEEITDDNLYLPVNVDYDKAFEVIDEINAERRSNGKSSLDADQTLMDAALIRATETVIYFEHARPNGGSWSSVSSKVMGENLGRGTDSVSRIMKLWMESPGHRANIVRSEFESVGVACVEYEGNYYWAQLFGTTGGSGAEHPENGTVSVALDLPEEGDGSEFSYDYEITGKNVDEIKRGSSVQLGLSGGGLSFDPAKVRWAVSDPAIAEIDEEGVLHVIGRGRAYIDALSGSIERASAFLDSRDEIEDAFILEDLPFVTVLGTEGILEEGRDYELRYQLEDAKDEKGGETSVYDGYEIWGLGEYKGIVNRLNP